MRRLTLPIHAIVLLVSLSAGTVYAADTPDEQYIPTFPAFSTGVSISFSDSFFTQVAGYLAADSDIETSDGHSYSTVSQGLCSSFDDALCHAGATISYLAHLPRCENTSDLDCVDSVFALKEDGTKVFGTYLRGLPVTVTNPYAGNPELGIARPGVDGLWSIPGVLNGGGDDTYVVDVQVYGQIRKPKGSTLSVPIPLYAFNAGIFPARVIQGNYHPAAVGILPTANGTMRLAYGGGSGDKVGACAAVAEGECALRQAFPPNVTFGFSLRLSQELKGWLHGRLRDPQIAYKTSASGTSLTIQALPVSVPIVSGWTERSNLPTVIPGAGIDPPPGSGMIAWEWGSQMISLLKLWLPLLKDTAQANPTEWIVRNLDSSEMQGADSCMYGTKSLAGVVTTNSTVYTAGPPQYNSDTKSLDYKLVSPHFTNKGDVFKGVYTLAIRSSVARCLYHFTNAPIKATISVTDDSGQSSVAVESMSERDGWIYLSASNFEFSSPTVHVKLMQDAPTVKPTGSPTPLVSPKPLVLPAATHGPSVSTVIKKQVPKKVTISCVKGALIKKITSVKPACPKGYRKLAA